MRERYGSMGFFPLVHTMGRDKADVSVLLEAVGRGRQMVREGWRHLRIGRFMCGTCRSTRNCERQTGKHC